MCSDVVDTSITIASSNELETALPDTTTGRCSDLDRRIGSLAIVPSGAESEAFSIRVVTGLSKSADSCIADGYLGGCIVARRSLHYIPHQTLYLPIEMSVICRDIPCGATETCSHGHCVDATITDVASCTNPKGCDVAAGGASGTGGTSSTAPSNGGATTVVSNTGGLSSVTSPIAAGTSGLTVGGGPTNGGTTSQGGTATNSYTTDSGMGGLDSTSQGGVEAFGGAAQGGAADSGGTYSAGGASATGDSSSTGGTSEGGSAQAGSASISSNAGAGFSFGGSATGGVATGGAATGGVATGGAATGGAAFGGTSADSSALGGSALAGAATTGSSLAGSTASGGSISVGGMTPTGGSSSSGMGGAAGSTGLPEICGDGILNPYAGEYCDTAGESTTCNANCTPERCGDGTVNAAAGEVCDGSTGSIKCTPSCRISICGDGYVDTSNGEQCEAGITGCTACRQDVSGLAGALRVRAVRDELLINQLGLKLTVTNSGPTVSTNGLSLRFYYTPDTNNNQSIDCSWSDVGCSHVSMTVKPLQKACANASHVAEIAINASSNLTSGSSFDVRGTISGGLLALYNFANDYSRPSAILLPAEAANITLYRNGTLVWGTPPCGCGNGALDNGEACDHAGETAACNADCTLARCGDGKVNAVAGETCDAGGPSLTCNPECHATGLPATAAPALLQWLDASQPTSLQLSPRIAAISDRSGKSNHVSQANPSKQPFWFPDAFGSLPAIFFDGASHELAGATPLNDLGRGSIFIVHRVDPVGITATLVANGWFGSGGGFAVRTRTQLDGLGISLGSSSGFATTQWTLGASSGSGPPTPRTTYLAWDPPSFAWASGADSETPNASASYGSTSNPLAIGGISAFEPYRGWIGEILVFDRMLSTSDRDAILTYLRQKWSVP